MSWCILTFIITLHRAGNWRYRIAKLRITFSWFANHFSKGIVKRPFFWYSPLFSQNFLLFLDTLYVYDAKNANTLQIMIRNSKSLYQNESQFHKNCKSLFVFYIQPWQYILTCLKFYFNYTSQCIFNFIITIPLDVSWICYNHASWSTLHFIIILRPNMSQFITVHLPFDYSDTSMMLL